MDSMSNTDHEIDSDSIVHLDAHDARLLAKRRDRVRLRCLQTMSVESALALASFDGGCIDIGSAEFSEDVAEALMPLCARGKLRVGCPGESEKVSRYKAHFLSICQHGAEMGPSLAMLYALCFEGAEAELRNAMVIRGADGLSADALAVFAKVLPAEATLVLEGLAMISPQLLTGLRGIKCELWLPELEEVSVDFAELLACSNASVRIAGSSLLSSQALALLCAGAGRVTLEGGWGASCKRPEQAELAILLRDAKSPLRLEFDSVTHLLAEAIACSACPELSLIVRDGMESSVAAALAQFSGELHLEACVFGDDDGHVALAKKVLANTSFWSSDAIGPNVAKAMVDAGRPSLGVSVHHLDVEPAKALALQVGELSVRTVAPMEADVASFLAGKDGNGALEIHCANGMTEDAAIAFRSARVPVTLGALKILTKRLHRELAGSSNIKYWPEELQSACGPNGMLGVRRVVLRDEDVAWDALPAGFGQNHQLTRVDIERCHGLKAFDFRGYKDSRPRAEPPLTIRLVDCAALASIQLLTERFCAQYLELRDLPTCKSVSLKVPDLEDLKALQRLTGLESLGLYGCPSLRSLAGIGALPSLSQVAIVECGALESLVGIGIAVADGSVKARAATGGASSIKKLVLKNCAGLKSLSGIEALTQLQELEVDACPDLSDLAGVEALVKLEFLTLRGPTSIRDLRPFVVGRTSMYYKIESSGVGAPAHFVAFDLDRIDGLGGVHVVCEECGSPSLSSPFSSRYSKTEFTALQLVRKIGETLTQKAVSDAVLKAVADLTDVDVDDAQAEGVEGLICDTDECTSYLDVKVAVKCDQCQAPFAPSIIESSWNDIGEYDMFGPSRSSLLTLPRAVLQVRRAEPSNVGKRSKPDPARCPVCHEAALCVTVGGLAKREEYGKCSGKVRLSHTPWNDLHSAFEIDQQDGGCFDAPEWRKRPSLERNGGVECANGCFRVSVSNVADVPSALLAVAAVHAIQQGAVDIDVVRARLSQLLSWSLSPQELVDGAIQRLKYLPAGLGEDLPSDVESQRQAAAELLKAAAVGLETPAPTVGESESIDFSSRVFCFTGTLAGMTRQQAEAAVKKHGAKTAAEITAKVTDVVVGPGAGSKRAKAEMLGLRIHEQDAFDALLKSAVVRPASRKSGPTKVRKAKALKPSAGLPSPKSPAGAHGAGDVGATAFAGRVFCFTGTLDGMTRAEAESRVKRGGGHVAASLTKKVTDLVVGEGGGSKRDKAEELGVRVLDQPAFEALLAGGAGSAQPLSASTVAASATASPEDIWSVFEARGEVDPITGKPREIVHRLTGAVLVLIPAGEFLMGSAEDELGREEDEVQHRRVIRKPFYLGKTAVTQAQWRKVMGSNPSKRKGDDLPVETVSWDDCQKFLNKAGGGMRLPSEAEWEYACRAGTTTPFSFGATVTPAQVNYRGNVPYGGASKGLYRECTVAVGSLPANAWGLHEMHGNVCEWCQDGYKDYPSSGTEKPSRAAGTRVLRGGEWSTSACYCRAAFRSRYGPGDRSDRIGLRLARTLPE
ncbi:MAG: SUMF1/EgtB/PvdO family nonheme iron enzyme [Planctomycetota bacterium]